MSSKTFTLHGFGRTALKLSVSDDGTCSTFAIASVGGEIRVTMHEWVIASVAYNANKHRPEILTEFEQSGFSELARQVRNHPFYQNPSLIRQMRAAIDNTKWCLTTSQEDELRDLVARQKDSKSR
jgi:hypothetical protein